MLLFALEGHIAFLEKILKVCNGAIDQLVDPSAHNGAVLGSSPSGPTKNNFHFFCFMCYRKSSLIRCFMIITCQQCGIIPNFAI